jgi:hypothetical protein
LENLVTKEEIHANIITNQNNRKNIMNDELEHVVQRMLSIGLVLFIVTLIVGLFLTTTIAMNWIPAITGVIVSIIWLISTARVGLIRLYVQSLLSLLLGVGLSLASLETYQSLAVYYAVMGLVLILSGELTLIRYLHQNPPLENNSPA